MKAVILAAGKGTRMHELTSGRPKPMLEVGKSRIVEHVLTALRGAGIREFIIVTGYFANIIEEFFADGSRLGITISYLRQDTMDGTASALHLARGAAGDGPFLMAYSDIITEPAHYPRLVKEYTDHPCHALLSLTWTDDPHRGAAVVVDGDNRIERIVEKPPPGAGISNWNNAGLYVFDPCIFDYTGRLQLSPRGEYELPDAITMMLEAKLDVRGFPLSGYWGDMGTPEDIVAMNRMLGDRERAP